MKNKNQIIIVAALFAFLMGTFQCSEKASDQNKVLKNEVANAVILTENSVDESAGNVPCYKIETPTAIYFLEKQGIGLSSMLDKDGHDWISFHNQKGSGSNGEYRGFPNAVHRQDGSFFHPKNSGTDPSATEILLNDSNHVRIRGVSGNGTWECLWDFYPTHCTFTMTKMPPDYKYWILYEGTPGGKYEDTDWWMTSAITTRQPLTVNHETDIPAPEWIVFGDPKLERVIFLVHHQDDEHIDKFYQMNQEMTVFGFGRKGLTKYLDSVPQSFSIGFIESTEHAAIGLEIRNIINQTKP